MSRYAMSPSLLDPLDSRALLAARMLLTSTLALIGMLILWEGWLAPIRPGGSWLALKALPLCAAVPGLAAGRPYTRQWLSLVLPFYVAEGVVRGWSEPGRVRAFASAEVVLAALAFALILVVVRRTRNASSGGGLR